jgi:hypothetical protein
MIEQDFSTKNKDFIKMLNAVIFIILMDVTNFLLQQNIYSLKLAQNLPKDVLYLIDYVGRFETIFNG